MRSTQLPWRLWPLGLAALFVAGCQPTWTGHGAEPRARPQPLRIAAASDLQRVLPRLAERFQSRTQATTTLTLDASGRLAEQIKAGAPFDLFLAANVKFVRDLADAGFIVPKSVQPFARGSLVLCLHQSVSDQVRNLRDLNRPEIKKLAIANPDYAPYGTAAQQALERAGLWSSLEPKIVRADSVRLAMVYAQNGDAEAALVSGSLADVPGVRVLEVDPALYDPVIQALGIVAATSQRDKAEAFAQFIVGQEGQKILREGGFEMPDAPPTARGTTPARSAGASSQRQ
jgi:molybdate transport system substrate-binding protein